MSYKPSDPLVAALVRLCEKEGGYEKVATATGLNKDHVWQIISGTTLASGNPRGVGPKSRSALTSAYPNWLDEDVGQKITAKNGIESAIDAIGAACETLSDDKRKELGSLLAMFVANPRESIKQVILETLCAVANKPSEHTSHLAKNSQEKLLKKG